MEIEASILDSHIFFNRSTPYRSAACTAKHKQPAPGISVIHSSTISILGDTAMSHHLEEFHGDVEVDGHLIRVQVLQQRQEDGVPHVMQHHLQDTHTHEAPSDALAAPHQQASV